jgi:hypothetical protein
MSGPLLVTVARVIAEDAHQGQHRKDGEPVTAHLGRVADRCDGNEAKAVAWLHDSFEDVPERVKPIYWPSLIHDAVLLLTHYPAVQTYRDYIERIAMAPGEAGKLAREVKRADLVDNLEHLTPELQTLRPRYQRALGRLTLAEVQR